MIPVEQIDWIARSQAVRFRVHDVIEGPVQPATENDLIEKRSPRDGRLLMSFVRSSESRVNDAVASARRAFVDGRWSKASVQQRKSVLIRLAELILEHREELSLLESLDVGKPIHDAYNFDVPTAAANLRFAAEAADKLYGKVYGVDPSSLSYELLRPVGVVAGIIGWNFPLYLAIQKIGPALAAGNSLILKPSEFTSLSACQLAQLALEAGLPAGVLSVVHGDAVVGASLASHPDVDLLTFTGSSRTGKQLMIAAGRSNMKRLILECGGKAPNIVFDDCADVATVADSVVSSAFWNQGQVCVASSRLLVQEGIKADLLCALVERTRTVAMGDPLLPKTRFGALVNEGHKNKVLQYIEEGSKEGARLIYQGVSSPPFPDGYYVPPSIFDAVRSDQKLAQEEIFGPVLSVLSFRDEDDAFRLANATIYGLSAIVWTQDVGRAHRVSQGIDAGSIIVNATGKPCGGPAEGVMSMGGHKQSGIGVEGGLEGLEAYTKKSAVQLFV
jgi:acyl-CoA reductase-like NAD-dependent aldehyde dehydrogenase